MLVILSGVAGAGKDTIKKEIIKRMENVKSIPSLTTRPPREGDVIGETYIFLSKEEFEEKIKNNYFLEYAKYAENYYGTPKEKIIEKLEKGIDVVLVIEIQGAMKIKYDRTKYEE